MLQPPVTTLSAGRLTFCSPFLCFHTGVSVILSALASAVPDHLLSSLLAIFPLCAFLHMLAADCTLYTSQSNRPTENLDGSCYLAQSFSVGQSRSPRPLVSLIKRCHLVRSSMPSVEPGITGYMRKLLKGGTMSRANFLRLPKKGSAIVRHKAWPDNYKWKGRVYSWWIELRAKGGPATIAQTACALWEKLWKRRAWWKNEKAVIMRIFVIVAAHYPLAFTW